MVQLDLQGDNRLRRFTRAEYDRLVELGFFEDEKVELLRGVIVEMSPQGQAHAWAVEQLNMILAPALVGRANVRPQLPFAAADDSEPEPDFAIVEPRTSPGEDHPARAYLLIEVAQSSLRRDRTLKAAIYAEAEVPEYWIVAIDDGCVEVHDLPREGVYTRTRRYQRGDEPPLGPFPDVLVSVDRLLP